MHQTTLNNRSLLHFNLMVLDITCDTRRRKEFQRLAGKNRANYRTVDDDMSDGNSAFDTRFFADHQGAFKRILATDVTPYLTIYAQPPSEDNVPFDSRSSPDQAADRS